MTEKINSFSFKRIKKVNFSSNEVNYIYTYSSLEYDRTSTSSTLDLINLNKLKRKRIEEKEGSWADKFLSGSYDLDRWAS
mmetsp:Transcript_14546/g.15238  ORF Transcript_14546/g.15238 Transcript_14546/m.15238 type:complete len:80 (-) Transcript_14546:75-314(-)